MRGTLINSVWQIHMETETSLMQILCGSNVQKPLWDILPAPHNKSYLKRKR
jgi:hypothetical protein